VGGCGKVVILKLEKCSAALKNSNFGAKIYFSVSATLCLAQTTHTHEERREMGGTPAQSKVKVIVRVRPLLESEPNTPCACAVDSKHVRIIIPGRTQSYSFKYVL
jgi:hypothetical protein